MNSTKLSGIYIHIPFCVKKCLYCDFLSFSNMEEYYDKYVEALIREIKSTEYSKSVDSIFIGGGTPSLLDACKINRILDSIRSRFNISDDTEITMEANPATLTMDSLKGYVKAGVNRISMGMQSTNEIELKNLGRIHGYEEFLTSYDMVRSVGIENVNIDIMSAIPGQTIESYEETLKRVINLRPEHISSYSLIIEEDTPFYEMNENGSLILPNEDDERVMYHMTKDILKAAGYSRYEISNYSLNEYESRHNIKYWTRQDYIGLGLGASSLVGNLRYNNISDINTYISMAGTDKIRQDREILEKKDIIEETMYLGLRLTSGINKNMFEGEFGVSLEKVYGKVIEKLEKQNLIKNSEETLVLTELGVDVSNRVLSEFLLDIL